MSFLLIHEFTFMFSVFFIHEFASFIYQPFPLNIYFSLRNNFFYVYYIASQENVYVLWII